MTPIIYTLSICTASCALIMALAMAWGRKASRKSHRPVMLLTDPAQCVAFFRRLPARPVQFTLPPADTDLPAWGKASLRAGLHHAQPLTPHAR